MEWYSTKIDWWSSPDSQGVDLMHGIVLVSAPDLTVIPKKGEANSPILFFPEIFAYFC